MSIFSAGVLLHSRRPLSPQQAHVVRNAGLNMHVRMRALVAALLIFPAVLIHSHKKLAGELAQHGRTESLMLHSVGMQLLEEVTFLERASLR